MRFIGLIAAGAMVARAEIYRAASPFERLDQLPVQYAPLDTPVVQQTRRPSLFRRAAPQAAAVQPPTGLLFEADAGVRVIEEGATPTDEEPDCQFYPEIVLVQDVSDSFNEHIKTIRENLPELFQKLKDRYQGKVRFGMTSFVDKYVENDAWGWPTDYCAKLEMPLADVDDDLLKKMTDKLNSVTCGGGKDYLDGANEAIVRSALSESVGWSTGTHDPVSGRPIVRLIILATDAGVHEAEYAQGLLLASGTLSGPLPPNDIVKRPSAIAKDINAECDKMDFPTVDDVHDALKSRGIIPIVFAGRPSWDSEQTHKTYIRGQYRDEVLNRFGQANGPWADLYTGLAAFYGDYFADQVGLDAVVQHMDDKMTNLLSIVDAALDDVQDMTCIKPSTSTTTVEPPPPEPTKPFTTTTPATTTPATTTPATTTPATTTPITTSSESSESSSKSTESSASSSEITESTAATDGDDGATTEASTTGAEDGGSSSGVVIGAAAGGGTAAVAAGLFAAKKMGLLFNNSSVPDMNISQDVDNVETTQDREQFEAVTGDLFA